METKFSTVEELTQYGLNLAFDVLKDSDEFQKNCTVVGAYALYKELSDLFDVTEVRRTTKDIDFDYYSSSFDDLDYGWFKKYFTLRLLRGVSVEFRPVIDRGESMTFSFTLFYKDLKSTVIKLDFALKNGTKVFDVTLLTTSLVNKLRVSNLYVDRRAKDKIDLCVLLNYLCPKGITKHTLLNDLEVSPNTKWFGDSEVRALRSLKGFRPERASGFCSNEECILWVSSLFKGLLDKNVPLDAKFIKGEWQCSR